MPPELPPPIAASHLKRRVALTVGLAAAAIVLQWSIQPISGGRLPFLFFLPAIIVGAAWGGLWPALAIAAMGAVNGFIVMRQGESLMIQTHPGAWAALAYVVVAAGLIYLGRRLYVATLRASSAEMRLRTAEDDAAVGLFEIDIANDTLFASSGFWQLLGRPPIDRPAPLAAWLRVLHPSDVEEARALLCRPPAQLRAEIEHRVLLPNGQTRWVMTRIRGEGIGDRTLRVRGVMVDITHRKEAAEALAKTQVELRQQLADLNELHELSGRLEATDDLVLQMQHILDTLTRMHGADRGLVALADETGGRQRLVASLGFSESAVARLAELPVGAGDSCGRAPTEGQRVVIEDVAADVRAAAYRDFAAAEGFRALHATPLVDHGGQLLGALVVHLPQPREITARERRLADICAGKAAVFVEHARAESRAREQDRRFRSVLDASAAGFAVLRPERDPTGVIRDFTWMYVNPAAAASWRRRPEQFIGKRVLDTLPGAWENSELFDAYVSVARDRQPREFEHESAQTTPRREWYHVIASPLDGDVAVWFTNVTARRRNEQALVEADQRKDEFLATLAHELRNPLAPIRQATQIAMTARASEAQKRWSYQVIERQVQHMSLLLDDLLDISRITRGQLRLRRQSCKLHEVFSAAVEAARPLIDKKGHDFELDLPASEVWVDADPLRLSQILSNLLTNAAKYTNPNGRIRATARSQGRELILEVADDGIGLEDTELRRVFNMFSQVTAAQERSEGGLGIGLALTRGLVQLHGGSIEAHSDGPGKGATFTARLPILSSAAPAAEGDAQRVAPAQAGSSRRRLVIADDNRDAAESLATLMRLEGHEVHLAHDGASALTALGSVRPDAALLDIGMPGLSGYELARAVREDPQLGDTFLVAITGWGQASDKARALSEGFDVHMTKPVDVRHLSELLLHPRHAPTARLPS